jgi:adenylate cyclase
MAQSIAARRPVPDVFLSYNRGDQEVARRFAQGLEAQGFSVWWDATLRSGEAYDEVTENALKTAKAVVVLWSQKSVVSRWVRAEATIGDRNKTLVPVMIEACERPIMFELTQTADLSRWQGVPSDPVWLALVADVKRFVERRSEPTLAVPALSEAPKKASAPAASVPAKPTVLILPFVNMSGDAEQEYFSDGVTEDIITDLGRISALSVISRSAAFSFKGKTVSPSQLAQTMKITHVLEGSVRKSGNRVRITAQLLDAASDAQVWGERFDRTLDDIFAIQEEISKAIVAALKVKLAPEETKAIAERQTTNSEAYELFLLARQFSRTGSERIKPLIVRICARVLEIDPGFARAWALLATEEAELANRNVPSYSFAHARVAAEKAMAIDPSLPEGYAAFAEVLLRDASDIDGALAFAAKAIALDPNCYEALLVVGYGSIANKRWQDSIRAFETAIALDELAYRPAGMVIQAYQAMGDTENALAAARRLRARCERILATEPEHSGCLGFLVTALADLGEGERAKALARRAVLFDPDNPRLAYNTACAMAGLGDAAMAVELIEPIVDKVSPGWLRWIESDNSLDSIRTDPRFVALTKRMDKLLGEGEEQAKP